MEILSSFERPNSEIVKKINRSRCVTIWSILRGNYNELISAYSRYKNKNGNLVYSDEMAKDSYDRIELHALERFCGGWYTNGINPDILPHPLHILICTKYGRDLNKAVNALDDLDLRNKYIELISSTISKANYYGIEL